MVSHYILIIYGLIMISNLIDVQFIINEFKILSS